MSAGGSSIPVVRYANVPRLIGILVANKMATLQELHAVYGLEAAYDLVEILVVDSHNKNASNKPEEDE